MLDSEQNDAPQNKSQRDNIVKGFRLGKIWVLICTELMGRGIDFKGVNLVVNYDFPPSAISYIHRIGRTGRAGRPGKAITFFTEDDSTNLRSIAQVMRDSGCEVPDFMLAMKKPKKSEKKKMLKQQPKRARISTDPFRERKSGSGERKSGSEKTTGISKKSGRVTKKFKSQKVMKKFKTKKKEGKVAE